MKRLQARIAEFDPRSLLKIFRWQPIIAGTTLCILAEFTAWVIPTRPEYGFHLATVIIFIIIYNKLFARDIVRALYDIQDHFMQRPS